MLTKKQKELYDYLKNYISSNEISPSFEEMKSAVNLKSKSGIHRLITSLEERGFIKRLKHKARAMEIIDELEKTKRKVYAGGIGYFSANGEFDTCIALRTAVAKNKKFYVQSGAGIVADSNPQNEYLETVNKAKALLKAIE